jgi:hypothetical protein
MKRLLSRMNVTWLSPFAQRGLDSLPVVRVTSMRLCATVSMMTMSPRSTPRMRRRLASHWPLAGGAIRRSASVRRFGVPPSRPTTHVDGWSSFGISHSKYSSFESPDQRRLFGGLPTSSGPRMMLSTVRGNEACLSAAALAEAEGLGGCDPSWADTTATLRTQVRINSGFFMGLDRLRIRIDRESCRS